MFSRSKRFLVAAVLSGALSVSAQQVIQITWPSRLAAEPLGLEQQQKQWMPALQLAFSSLPEESVIALGLTQGAILGLEESEANRLQPLLSSYYTRVRRSAAFHHASSALPYCYAEKRPATGLATVYFPAMISASTRRIVFLHGFGGSLLAYTHYIASTFSNDVIICPAYGISPATVPGAYIAEALSAVQRREPRAKQKTILIGLSAGGVGACRVFASHPASYAKLVCLGSIPPSDAIARFPNGMNVTFISGAHEPQITDGSFGRQLKALQQRSSAARSELIAGADHYFLLSREAQTRVALVKAVGK
jgi:pimeloyl-ACP methyl ester carboxylesterase